MKSLLLAVLLSSFIVIGLFIYQRYVFNDGKLHITICDVGQGDAIFIRTPSSQNILFDGGPDSSVLSCLSRSMPLWDRTIDIIFLSHPHQDHFIGLFEVMQRYDVRNYFSLPITNQAPSYQEFERIRKEENISLTILSESEKIKINEVTFSVLGPSHDYIQSTTPNLDISDTSEFGSLLLLITYKDFKLLLSGDSQTEELHEAIKKNGLKKVNILQIPHHGSRFGLDEKILSIIRPEFAFISVGKRNRYSHPSKKILDLLHLQKIEYRRTDRQGEIKIKTDGFSYTFN